MRSESIVKVLRFFPAEGDSPDLGKDEGGRYSVAFVPWNLSIHFTDTWEFSK
jgi:hypothetical protein